MWPMFVDYTDDECKRLLRSLELEAYAAVISAFRAQGSLSKDKRRILQDLCNTLSISIERHRAEIRRAVNDEHLNTVAERLSGSNTSAEWAIEGRRVVPLMQRLAPQTVFTDIANSAANAQATKNASLPLPGRTGLKEISNGIETMASRKRKDLPPDFSVPPYKLQTVDNQYLNISSYDNSALQNVETPHVPETLTAENMTVSEVPLQDLSPLSDYISSKIPPMAHVPSLVSPVKSSAKQLMLKSSTVTTYSNFDPMTSNLLLNKPSNRGPLQASGSDGNITPLSETVKTIEPKNLQRSSSTGAMRTTVIPHTMPSSGSTPSSGDRTSSSASSQSKFVNQLRSKPPAPGRQNLPSGLGVKLNIQPQMTQRAVSPKSSSSKGKPEANPSFLTKKPTAGVFPPICQSEITPSQFSMNESLTITKTTSSVQKSPTPKTESQPISSHQSSKVPVTKALPKVSTSSSQYISRSLFGGGTKGAKTLPPVIFNVSSSATLQTPTKTTGPVQSEAGKGSSSQLLPKSTAIGVSQSHMKLGGSTTQTIQYRNDGGLVRSARIINVTPPAGSRLPCSITPSAISALGLSSNITSGALRVTLPAGTLNTSASMRASAVAKPNVIVVHKAQMWPRSQGAAAVIMSSTPVQRMSDSNSENTQKQEKSKPSPSTTPTSTSTSAKPQPRSLPTPRPQSPNITSATIKVPDTSNIRTPSPSPVQQTDNSATKEVSVTSVKATTVTQTSVKNTTNSSNSRNQINIALKNQVSAGPTSQKIPDDVSEQCKKNLLADVMEASGLILENIEKSILKEKVESSKKEKDFPLKVSILSSMSENPPKSDLTSSVSKSSTISVTKSSESLSAETVSLMSDASIDNQNLKRHDKADDLLKETLESAIAISSLELPAKSTTKKQTEESKDSNS